MKKTLVLFLGVSIVLFGFFSFFPIEKKNTDNKKIRIAATTFPIYDIARIVAGDAGEVQLIVPPGTSPHSYDVSPETIRQMTGSDILFVSGHGIDDWIASVHYALPDVPAVVLDKNISLRASTEEEEHDAVSHDEEVHEDHHGPVDPHYWLNPDNAKIMAETIAVELGSIDPIHAGAFLDRKDAFVQELTLRDEQWQARLAPFTKRDILTFHDAFYYFADHFTLSVVATFEPFAGKEPSPQYLANLHEVVKEHDITVLFIEPQLARSGLEAFAADVGASIGVLDEMGGALGKESYIDLIDANVRAVEEALQHNQ